jgi:tape measure domain-containing protein
MAFDTLGVNVTASGIKGVANDIGRLAASFVKYVGAVKKAEEASNKAAIAQSLLAKKMADKAAERQAKLVERAAKAQEKLAAATLKAAQSQVKFATSMAGSAQTNLDKLIRKQGTLSSQVTSLTAKVASLTLTMRNHAAVKVNYDSAVAQVQKYEQTIKNVEATARTTKAGKIYLADALKIAPIVDALRTKLSAANIELAKQSKIYAQSITQQAAYRNAIAALSKAMQELVNTEKGIPVARERLVRATADAAEAEKYLAEMMANSGEAATEASEGHQKLEEVQEAVISQSTELENGLDAVIGMLNDSSGAVSGLTSIISQLVPGLSSLSGGLGATGGASAALSSTLGISAGALAAIATGAAVAAAAVIGLVISFKIMKAAAKLVVDAMKIVIKVIQTAWQIFKKLASVVWDVASAIGKTLWSAVKKIASAPFKLISSLFGGMGGSMQRVLEMAIGMNLSRVWWQLGMKIRDMFKTATDSAIEFQVTYTRLNTLMKNEVIGRLGPSPSTDEYKDEYNAGLALATEQTKELITWTSKLAVLTIFGAEDILNVYTLAMSYGFASTQAEKLTESVLDFASGMGLGDTEMKRIIENFGQMRAQGKITGTELRDLARGSFVPVNDVLEEMAKNVGLVGDYDVPNMQAINEVLQNMADNGEITNETFTTMSGILQKLGSDGKITRQEFDTLIQDMSQSDVMQKFGLNAEQAQKALEGIKTGKLTAELNELIKTGKITIDEFFEAFIEMVENKYPNAAKSMGLTMKAVKSNIEDYIATMIGWRLIAPVFEVVAKHVQNFIQSTLMTDKQIADFDKMGKALNVVTELYMTYYEALRKTGGIFSKVFGSGQLATAKRFFGELVEIVGSLGTADFDLKIGRFDIWLKNLGLSPSSQGLVSAGIKNLNNIMKDILAGVEIDPESLQKSLKDVFGTLWSEVFGPTIKKALQTAWEKYISPAISKLWKTMKDKFSEWKTEELVPGIRTFFRETLPGWISKFGTWIREEGPGIVLEIGQFVSDILTEFIKITAFHFGEDSPLTRLLVVLEELFKYGAQKIADPTSSINADNAQNLADAFGNLGTSLKNAFFGTDIGKKALSWINSEEFRATLTNILTLAGLLGDLATVILGPFKNGMDEMGSIDISGITRVIRNLAAMILRLIGTMKFFVNYYLYMIDVFMTAGAVLKDVELFGGGNIFDQFYDLLKISLADSPFLKNMAEAVDVVKNANDVLDGLGAYDASGKVDSFIDWLNDWSDIPPLDPVALDQPFTINVTGHVESENLPLGITYDGGLGKFVFGGTSVGQSVAPPIAYVQPFTVNGQMDFENLPQGYTYNESTGLLEFDPVIANLTMKRLPIIALEQPITIDGKTYYNLPPGFSVNPTTGKLEWKSAQGDIVTDPIVVKQKLDLVTELLSKSGWGIDPYTGNITWVGTGTSTDTDITQNANLLINLTGLGLSKDGKELGSKKELIEQMFGEGEAIEPIKLDVPIETGFQEIITNAAAAFENDTTIQVSASAMAVRAANAIKTENTTTTADFQTFTDGLSTIMETASGPFTTAGTNAVAGLRSGMEGEFEALLIWWIKQVAKLNAIVPTMNNSNSPSRLYRGFGEDMMKGLQLGLESGQVGAVSQMHDAAIELRQALGAINTGTISPQQYNNVSNTTNWNVNVTTPLVASTPIQAYEILRMRAR